MSKSKEFLGLVPGLLKDNVGKTKELYLLALMSPKHTKTLEKAFQRAFPNKKCAHTWETNLDGFTRCVKCGEGLFHHKLQPAKKRGKLSR